MRPPSRPSNLGRRRFTQGTAAGALSLAVTGCSDAPTGAGVNEGTTEDGGDSGRDSGGASDGASDGIADSTTDAPGGTGATTTNDPGAPVWSTVPTISFVEGVPSEVSVAAYVDDPDGDALTLMLNDVELPAGVTFDPDGMRFVYDGAGPAATTTDHVLTADDGMN